MANSPAAARLLLQRLGRLAIQHCRDRLIYLYNRYTLSYIQVYSTAAITPYIYITQIYINTHSSHFAIYLYNHRYIDIFTYIYRYIAGHFLAVTAPLQGDADAIKPSHRHGRPSFLYTKLLLVYIYKYAYIYIYIYQFSVLGKYHFFS